ncbi:MAG: hypothetical protein J0J04_08520 [Microbacterium sp.]|uniref:hypothetical protein n=1 Tax=Microbacterium sp. TaxID=51671 RepID=UPI001AD2B697|nr:hypothetical protein [Microbacterium sp.]MBN9214820.1 hypothetical protein [Microbacterium sp.]
MGHALHTETITVERAEEIRKGTGQARHQGFWGYRPTFESEMVDAAVEEWRATEANRFDGERAGDGYLTPVMSPQQARDHIDANIQKVSAVSVVIPIARTEDLVTKTSRVKVTLTPAEMNQLRKAIAASAKSTYEPSIPYQLRDKAVAGIDGVNDVSIAKVPAARKVAAKTTPGKLVTQYRVVHFEFTREIGLATADTLAEARAKGLEIAAARPELGELSLVAVTTRVTDDGKSTRALLTIGAPERDETTVEFNVTTVTANPSAKIDHYEVTFDYHH